VRWSDRGTAGDGPLPASLQRIHGTPDRDGVGDDHVAPLSMGLHERYDPVNRLGDRHPPTSAGYCPRRCHDR